jgi:hypothetical protein
MSRRRGIIAWKGTVVRRFTITAVVAAILLAVTGCLTPLTSQPPQPTPPKQLAPVPTPASPLVGVYEPGSPGSYSGVTGFTSATGVKPKIVVYYSSWNDPFATSFAETAWEHGAYVLVQLEPSNVSLASIAAGVADSYLRSYAEAVAAFGFPVILSFGHEMNGNWYSWGDGHTAPATFVAAWRHIVQVFRAEKAANVTWLWAVNSVDGASSDLSQWWPGASYVNWTGIDGYFFQSTDTFDSLFGSTIADIRTFSDAPMMIAETAVGTTSNRNSQINALFAGVSANNLAGAVWFDEAQDSGLYHQDWRLEDDPSALKAFTAAVAANLGG